MAHRTILTERQRADLFDLPTDETILLRHYILADDDIECILTRRRAHNRFGFALSGLFAFTWRNNSSGNLTIHCSAARPKTR